MRTFPRETPAPPRTHAVPGASFVAAALVVALAACAQAQPSDPTAGRASEVVGTAGEAPLPPGWVATARDLQDRSQRRHRPDAPLWGVPAFAAPAATHCARPPALAEVAGPSTGRQAGRTKADGAGREHRAESASRTLGAAGDASATVASPAPPAASEAPAVAARASGARSGPAPDGGGAPVQSLPRQPGGMPKAGMVDDNSDFTAYLAFVDRHASALQRQRDVSERYRVLVTDARGRPVPDAELALSWPGAPAATRWARTDAAGTAWLHPRALLDPYAIGGQRALEVQARGTDGSVARAALVRGQRAPVHLRVGAGPAQSWTPLDLVFMVDATGSMGDEIDKLRTSMQSIADRIARLPGRVDLCLGLVAYRDRGDEYVTRRYDLTGDLAAFQRVLGGLRAAGGGDEPEALDEALHETVHGVSWRGAGASRLVVMIGDAPPHLRPDVPHYDQSAVAALARGIKVHAVGASGLNRQGETTFRSIAQQTGGRFVFLTYKDAARPGRGPGTETPHDVRDYGVADLDELIVRLVREELAARTGGQ
jgi:hypothetical protein